MTNASTVCAIALGGHLQRGVHEAKVAGVGQAAGLHAAGAPGRTPPCQLRQRPV